ncbi:putative uncharacterized protein [Pseudomonas sp. StFLB209]|uniref:TPM domain-containing protein n=1 Tax=Pseudomonas sp. StFLB209 TaxID=1028989 RepID=UPI0004F91FAB|nr:TPM domain-containing protein [Pseudomonas sp. StFLB209]BAP43668.1 putative uncharacterized protein [Pseudomonas sp. StFLB209]
MRVVCAGEALKFVLGWVLWCCICSQVVRADEPALLFPPLTGRVVDAAQLLDMPTTARLSQMFQEHEQATGEQIVVVTLVDLQGATIEEYGVRLAKTWSIGQKGKHNGVLLIVSRDNRKVRIEAGSGLRDQLSDAQSALIINMLVTPQFREGNFATGIELGSQAIVTALGGHVPDGPEPGSENLYPGQPASTLWPALLVLAALVLMMSTCAMTNLGRRMRLKGSSAATRHDDDQGFGGGGASGNW